MPFFNTQRPRVVTPTPAPQVLTSLAQAAGLNGTYNFDFGNGEFQASVEDGWVLVLQYLHAGGTNPNLNIISAGDWPLLDASSLGTDGSADLSSWGHISQSLAASIPDLGQLRFYGQSDQHSRIVNFSTPVLGKFVSNGNPSFAQGGIRTNFTPLAGHTASIPNGLSGTQSNGSATGDLALTHEAVFVGASNAPNRHWDIKAFGAVWEVDDYARTTVGAFASSTIHRVFVGPS